LIIFYKGSSLVTDPEPQECRTLLWFLIHIVRVLFQLGFLTRKKETTVFFLFPIRFLTISGFGSGFYVDLTYCLTYRYPILVLVAQIKNRNWSRKIKSEKQWIKNLPVLKAFHVPDQSTMPSVDVTPSPLPPPKPANCLRSTSPLDASCIILD
jgi:hypothetical protein